VIDENVVESELLEFQLKKTQISSTNNEEEEEESNYEFDQN
jgi:hypothetical protein